jgi:hypothetical protein
LTIPEAPVLADAQWRKSSYSDAGNNCVEVARVAGGCAVRDSKNPDGGHMIFSADAWAAFVTEVKRGRYDM